jgi:hypothetical protein
MAQNTFTPTGSETHLNAKQVWNGNADDAEARLSILENTAPQTLSSTAGALVLDSSSGCNGSLSLNEDVSSFSITNTASGDSGLILVKQDTTAGWTFTSTYDVLAGDLADIASITPSGSGAASVGWYNDGSDNYLFVSSFT